MQEVLALTLHAMQNDMQRLDRVSSNLANVATPGYQREIVSVLPTSSVSPAFGTVVDGMAQQAAITLQGRRTAQLGSQLAIQTDVRPGTLKPTGQALDVALSGPGYFEVMTDAGPAYTRQGNFRLDGRGRLVTAQGFPVMGKGGEIFLSGERPSIDASGNVFASDRALMGNISTAASPTGSANAAQTVAQLKVVQIEDAANVQRLGNGLVTTSAPMASLKDAEIQVRQGFLEAANVDSAQEMIHLMQTMRHFESMQKIALGYDDMVGQAVRKLGELS